MVWKYDDGGRSEAGFRGTAGDCVTRAVAIASGRPYGEVYSRLAAGAGHERKSKGATVRNGIHTKRKWFKEYMSSLGFSWRPTMMVGQGCRIHLTDGELPSGRLVVALSKHLTTVIDGVIYDVFDPQREVAIFARDTGRELKPGESRNVNGIYRIARRCVYGYWKLA